MLKNYLKIAFRNLWKHKVFTLINVAGLGLGMAVSFIILQFVVNELSYDRFHKNGSRIFRVANYDPGEPEVVNMHPRFKKSLAPHLMETNPAITQYVRTTRPGNVTIKNPRYPERLNIEPNFAFVDPSFFSVFTFKILQGNPANFLSDPFGIVISKAIAEKYFGHENPIGQKLIYKGYFQSISKQEQLLEVRGVMENPPANSTFQYEIISSTTTYELLHKDYQEFDYETFLLLDSENAVKNIERQLPAACKFVKTFSYDEKHKYKLEPLFSFHSENYAHNFTKVKVFSGIAATILLLALFNYINLTTARATIRAKEVGIRKTLGVTRFSLLSQFFSESLLITAFAFFLASVLLIGVRSYVNDIFGFRVDLSVITSFYFLAVVFLILVVTALIAGSYPALVLSNFSPVKVLKGNFVSGSQSIHLRRLFIVLQFAVSTVLILSSIVVQRQVSFLKNVDPGYNKEQLLNITLSWKMQMETQVFKEELKNRYGFQNISSSSFSFKNGLFGVPFYNPAKKKQGYVSVIEVDEDFVKNVGITLKVPVNKNIAADMEGFYYLPNEEAIKELGLSSKNAVGHTLFASVNKPMSRIAGVVKNFDIFGPKFTTPPCILKIYNGITPTHQLGCIQIRLNPKDNLQQKVAVLEKVYRKYEPDWPFEYSFTDEDFAKTFEDELRISKMMQVFTCVAVFLACMGLFGLITFTTQTRTKEIGIRKVLGANVLGIAGLLSVDFIKLVVLSIVIALPSSYYLANQWLQNFPHRVEVSWWIYILTALSSIFLALFTVSYQSIKAALKNPVSSLKIE